MKQQIVTCQECALGVPVYVPCGRPARNMVGWKGRDETPIPMCDMCTDHNVRNRNGQIHTAPLAAVVFATPEPEPEPEPVARQDFKIGDMIAKFHEIKAALEVAQEAFDAEWKPYKEAMLALQTACGAGLTQQCLQNFKSDAGTAYLKKGDSVTVVNRDEYLKFVLDGHLEFLDARVLKDPVRAWTDEHSAPPPGVKIEPFVQCIIRK